MRAQDTHTVFRACGIRAVCRRRACRHTRRAPRSPKGSEHLPNGAEHKTWDCGPRCHRKLEADKERQESLKDETRGRKVMTRQICRDRFVRAGEETETTKKKRQIDGGGGGEGGGESVVPEFQKNRHHLRFSLHACVLLNSAIIYLLPSHSRQRLVLSLRGAGK